MFGICMSPLGCQSDQSKEDDSRSYFDGGPLRVPEPNTLVLTGRVLSAQGRVEEAEYVLKRVIVEFPEFGPGYVELAEVLVKDGRTMEAIAALVQGANELPSYALLRNDLGMCLLLDDKLDAAARAFTEARRLDPNEATYTTNLAMVLALKGQYDAAFALYSEVIPAAQAHANVAVLADARGDGDRAQQERAMSREQSYIE
jgi:Flp pilus assembly protein TadD